jgi:hypothetical protein
MEIKIRKYKEWCLHVKGNPHLSNKRRKKQERKEENRRPVWAF